MDKKTIAILSNVTIDMVAVKLKRKYNVYIPGGYDAWVSEAVNSGSPLYSKNVEAVFVLLDGMESQGWKDYSAAIDRITLWRQGICKLAENMKGIPVFISTLDIRMNRILAMSEINLSHRVEKEWAESIENVMKDNSNCFIYDMKDSVTDIGRKNFYSEKMWYMGSMPFSKEGIQRIVNDIECLMTRYYTVAKKILVLDLDNTLWGGVIGEDGIDGIELSDHKQGQRFYDFQRQILEMKNRGVLLTINSKNNPEDVKRVFEEHPYMLLKWDDFAAKKINWQTKAQNIKELEQELNITEGSFVFVDDNPMEREIITGECPEVTVLDFPEDTTQLVAFAENFYMNLFKQSRVLDEDIKKTELYLAEEKRKTEMSDALNLDDYISKLEMEADIHLMRKEEQERVVQLCNKTNQFNVTAKRYTEKEISEMCKNPEILIYTVNSRDKYGEAGLISVLIVQKSGTVAAIDTFLMSCRVMGRKLEDIIAGEVLESLKNHGIETVKAKYICTAKNTPVKELFEQFGFKITEENECIKKYELKLAGWNRSENHIYKSITFQGETDGN